MFRQLSSSPITASEELAAIGMESSNLVSSNGARDRLNCQLYSPDIYIYIYILIHTHMEPDGHHKLVTHTFTHGMAFLAIGLN